MLEPGALRSHTWLADASRGVYVWMCCCCVLYLLFNFECASFFYFTDGISLNISESESESAGVDSAKKEEARRRHFFSEHTT